MGGLRLRAARSRRLRAARPGVDRRTSGGSGGGLLAAITLDGVPENLALGVALIGAGPLHVAALSGSIFLSNLPEAAGGARDMSSGPLEGQGHGPLDRDRPAALGGRPGGQPAAGRRAGPLALVRAFAGGAVVASLATEVYPKAFKEDSFATGLAAALGLVLAVGLDSLG